MISNTKQSAEARFEPVRAQAHPSLALIKYWGKLRRAGHHNVPATTSIGVTLSKLLSTVRVSSREKAAAAPSVRMLINGVEDAGLSRVRAAFGELAAASAAARRAFAARDFVFEARNNFPTAAGLASSSSGGAAFALALLRHLRCEKNAAFASAAARAYSGSACRAVFGGFTIWEKGALYARPLADGSHWPDLRIIVVPVTKETKKISSREGMGVTRATSPYYRRWTSFNESLAQDAARALLQKDIEKLGELTVRSYTAMHAGALAAYPPVLYWQPASVALLHEAASLRARGVAVWETMDAGPQVKFITLAKHVPVLRKAAREITGAEPIVCAVGDGARVVG